MGFISRKMVIICLIAIFMPIAWACAQPGDLLKSVESATSNVSNKGPLDEISNLTPGQMPNTTNINNIAGVLQYCIQNNYVTDNGAALVGDSLKGKLSESERASDNNYTDGLKGILHSKDGNRVALGGSGLKAAATQQICDTVLSTAKSNVITGEGKHLRPPKLR